MNVSRRKLFLVPVLGTAFVLAGCKTITSGDSTTVVLDTSKVINYVTAGINAATMITAILVVNPALTEYNTKLKSAVVQTQFYLNEFKSIVGTSQTFTYNGANYKTIVDSLLVSISNILSIIDEVANSSIFTTSISSNISNTVLTIRAALATVVNIYSIMIGFNINTASGGNEEMSEPDALKALNVTV